MAWKHTDRTDGPSNIIYADHVNFLHLDDEVWGGIVSAAGYPLQNLPAPSDPSDAANKAYVDAAVAGAATAFVDLTDTPGSFAGSAGLVVKVNPSEDGLVFAAESGGGNNPSDFLDLNDTPASYSGEAGKYVRVNPSETGLIFDAVVAGAGAFVDLTDTPSTLTGHARELVRVNPSGTALEYSAAIVDDTGNVDIPSGAKYRVNGSAHTHPVGEIQASGSPSAFTFLRGDGAWANPSESPVGATHFLALTDTPSSYFGKANWLAIINPSETGLAFGAWLASKAVTVESPTGAEDITLWFTDVAIDVSRLNAVVTGPSLPSVTWTIRHDPSRAATGAEVVASGTTTTSETSGSEVTAFDDGTIPAGSWIWLETTAVAGSVDTLNVTIHYIRA